MIQSSRCSVCPTFNKIRWQGKIVIFLKRHSLNCIPFTGEEVFLVKFIHIDVNSDACDKQCCQFLSLISIKLIYLHIRRCISTRLMFARFLRGMFRINLEWPQSFSTKTFKKTQKRMVKLFSGGLGLSSQSGFETSHFHLIVKL